MERWQAKLLALIGTFVLPLLVTMLPYKFYGFVSSKGKTGERVLSYLMCFGGGIFFGTYLIHMGPEVRTLLDKALLTPYNIHYPIPELLTGLGFFFVLFSEKIVLKWNRRRLKRKQAATKDATSFNQVLDGSVRRHPCDLENQSSNHVGGKSDPAECVELIVKNGDGGTTDYRRPENGVIVSPKQAPEEDEDDDQAGSHHNQHSHHSTRSIILILALSMHRIFEGMTIGLQSTMHNLWSLFLAVMCHELVIGFSLGLQLVKSRLTLKRMSIASFFCSAIMPVGMAIGIVLTELGREDDQPLLANGVLQAIAMGTFVYVTFFEILQEEIDPEDTSLCKVLFIFAGFVMMALLDQIPEEDGTQLSTTSAHQHLTPSPSNATLFDGNYSNRSL